MREQHVNVHLIGLEETGMNAMLKMLRLYGVNIQKRVSFLPITLSRPPMSSVLFQTNYRRK